MGIEPFHPEDFPASEFLVPEVARESYPRWAALQANYALSRCRRSLSPARTLSDIAASRRRLQGMDTFGRTRRRESSTPLGSISLLAEAKGVRREILRAALDRKTRRRVPVATPRFPGARWALAHHNWYRTVEGKRWLGTSVLEIWEGERFGNLWLRHAPPESISPILDDVWTRTRLALDAARGAEAFGELARAIRGYYNAMPFERGSASIGRSFWAGIGSWVLRRKVVIPDGTDVWAMVLAEREFERRLRRRLSSPRR